MDCAPPATPPQRKRQPQKNLASSNQISSGIVPAIHNNPHGSDGRPTRFKLPCNLKSPLELSNGIPTWKNSKRESRIPVNKAAEAMGLAGWQSSKFDVQLGSDTSHSSPEPSREPRGIRALYEVEAPPKPPSVLCCARLAPLLRGKPSVLQRSV